jgi:cell division protein FtsB
MLRAVIVFLILAAIAGFFVWRYHTQEAATIAQQQQQLDDLNVRISKLKSDNDQLHDQLEKIQEENNNLKVYNDAGKVPLVMPYPPK